MTALSLSAERAEKDVMQQKPRAVNQPILDRLSIVMVAFLGGYIGVAVLILHYLYMPDHDYALANTVAFTAVVVLSNLCVLNFRSFAKPLSVVGFVSNPWMIGAVAGMMLLQAGAIYMPVMQEVLGTVPLAGEDWLIIVAASMPMIVIPEIVKAIRYRSV